MFPSVWSREKVWPVWRSPRGCVVSGRAVSVQEWLILETESRESPAPQNQTDFCLQLELV